uniref:Uncharacterized protein n=1 Tax=Kalanchoe fedtschenkoi TaxID=63787 RepID=A0A7N1A0E0_KALFE
MYIHDDDDILKFNHIRFANQIKRAYLVLTGSYFTLNIQTEPNSNVPFQDSTRLFDLGLNLLDRTLTNRFDILVQLNKLEQTEINFKHTRRVKADTSNLCQPGFRRTVRFALDSMESSTLQPGTLISLSELHPDSQYFKQEASLRVTGKLQEYHVETAIATIADGGSTLKIDTQHLRNLTFRKGSIYQFIGELLIQHDNEGILNARVGRNVDGIDLNLYQQSIKLLRRFQAGHMSKNDGAA